LRGYEKTSVFANCVSRDYAGELKNVGDTVRVPKLGPVLIKNYTRGGPISYDEVDGSTLDVTVDQEKYWGLRADDVDQLQSSPPFLDGATKNAAYALRDTIDSYTAGILTAGAGTKLYESGSPYNGGGDMIDLFTELACFLDELNVPRGDRFAVVPPFIVRAITKTVIDDSTSNETALSEAFITRIAGFYIFMSNNLISDTDATKVVAGVRPAATHIVQISKVETLRDKDSFSDLVRGLAVYTSAVLMPEGLITARVRKPA
jgi:hypothetical protein